jgi:hypothetical protein
MDSLGYLAHIISIEVDTLFSRSFEQSDRMSDRGHLFLFVLVRLISVDDQRTTWKAIQFINNGNICILALAV